MTAKVRPYGVRQGVRLIDLERGKSIEPHQSKLEAVREWRRAMGLTLGSSFDDPAWRALTARVLAEEYAEALSALLGGKVQIRTLHTDEGHLGGLRGEMVGQAGDVNAQPDPEQFLDAITDEQWVGTGALADLGWDAEGAFDEVHRSNWTKAAWNMDAGGKLQKGPNFDPPKLGRFIRS